MITLTVTTGELRIPELDTMEKKTETFNGFSYTYNSPVPYILTGTNTFEEFNMQIPSVVAAIESGQLTVEGTADHKPVITVTFPASSIVSMNYTLMRIITPLLAFGAEVENQGETMQYKLRLEDSVKSAMFNSTNLRNIERYGGTVTGL